MRPGNIKDWITRLNRIRKENRALHFYDNLRFYRAENDAILFYGKMTRRARQHHPGGCESRSASHAEFICRCSARQFGAMEGDTIRCTIF